MAEIVYHGTCDTTFAPRVEHVPAREIFPEYYRVWLNPEVMLTFSRAQLVQLFDAIRDGYQVEAPLTVHQIFAPSLKSIFPAAAQESDIEELRRRA